MTVRPTTLTGAFDAYHRAVHPARIDGGMTRTEALAMLARRRWAHANLPTACVAVAPNTGRAHGPEDLRA